MNIYENGYSLDNTEACLNSERMDERIDNFFCRPAPDYSGILFCTIPAVTQFETHSCRPFYVTAY